jgi:hypothetical protein
MQIPRLHPDTIEEVKIRADIVDVVSEYVVNKCIIVLAVKLRVMQLNL